WLEGFEHLEWAGQNQWLDNAFTRLAPRNEPPDCQQAKNENGGQAQAARVVEPAAHMELRCADNQREARHEDERKDGETEKAMCIGAHVRLLTSTATTLIRFEREDLHLDAPIFLVVLGVARVGAI